jgi:acyl carrier protein
MPDYDQTVAELCELARPFAKPGQGVDAQTGLVSDLGLDSIQVLELLNQVEDHFDVSIPLNVMPDVRTIGDFARELHRLSP